MNWMLPLSSGWPSSVTTPDTTGFPAPQPTTAVSARAAQSANGKCLMMSLGSPKDRRTCETLQLVVADDLGAVHGAERPPGGQVDGVLDERDRPVRETDVDSARVAASRAVLLPVRSILQVAGQGGIRVGPGTTERVIER